MSDWNEAIQRMQAEAPPARISNLFVASEHELNLMARARAAGRLEGIREAAEVVTGLNVPLPPEMGLDESSFTAGTTAFAVAAATAIESLASKKTSDGA